MSWTNRTVILAASLVVCGCVQATPATHTICPAKPGNPLRYVDVYDGAPAELAVLQADAATPDHGHWKLGYVYDAGRFVTIRCTYTDKQTDDVKLDQRINRCDYRITKHGALSLSCTK